MNSKTPVRLSTETISIIPRSRKMTFQSMPASSEKKAWSASVTPSASMITAPPRAAFTRCTHSAAIRT